MRVVEVGVRKVLKILDRWQRILATGFCFSLFGIGGLCLSIVVFPLQQIFIREPIRRRQAARLTVHYSFKFFVSVMQWTRVFKVQCYNADYLADLQGKVIVANHPSLIDIVVMISLIRNADCVVKGDLLKNPFMRGVIRASGYLSNAAPDLLLADCAASLAQGNNIIIFPEGTRSDHTKPLKLQRGFANIALRCRADVVFILLSVTPLTLTKNNVWYNVPSRTFDFTLKVKDSLSIASFNDDFSDNFSKAARQLTRQIESQFKQELKQELNLNDTNE